MKTRITRIAAVGLAGVLAFGLTACEDDVDDPDTTVVEDDEDADGGDTTIEEGDDTDVTVEEESTEDAATDTATEDAATDTATEDAEG